MFQYNILVNRKALSKSKKPNNEKISNIILNTIVIITIFVGITLAWKLLYGHQNAYIPLYNNKKHADLLTAREATAGEYDESQPWDPNCTYWDCFNVYRCGQKEQGRMTIYVYPLKEYLESNSGTQSSILTKEYYRILETVMQSDYFTPNPNEACLFLPSMDLLNEHLLVTNNAGKALVSLDYWDSGENHLIFNIIPGSAPALNRVLNISTDKAIILGGGYDSHSYRNGFDVAIPVWSPLLESFDLSNEGKFQTQQRKYFLIAAQLQMSPEQQRIIKNLAKEHHTSVLVLKKCKTAISNENPTNTKITRCDFFNKHTPHEYPHVLSKGTFCLMARAIKMGDPILLEMLAHQCIPVVVSNNIVLPFEDVIDWSLAVIRIREFDMHSIMQKLRSLSHHKIQEMQQQGGWLFQKYFKDLSTITLTALDILNERIFPHLAKTNLEWNTIDTNCKSAHNPLFQPIISVNSQGFTAVILTYDRVESLFTLIQKLSVVSSLQSILVIWNNQRKAPPQLSMFPKIMKPLKIIHTHSNKLSNRFYPYDEIETEAILTIDDDIVMLTADELNFGFEVWREFPDRIVGFPSRIHIWENATKSWHYESEWTNQISMVLTGAAFHHKYWSYMYTNAMPVEIKDWVDEHMNCEDIAMNFLVANITNKPPIKVAPRKKFKCPECTNTEMLSAYLNHMMERSTCIDRFAQFYGHMPLRSVEFRADPVLYKDNFPEKLKRFNDIGSL